MLSFKLKEETSKNVADTTFNGQCPTHIETSQLICRANQLTSFYVRGTLTVKGLSNKFKQKLLADKFA